MTTNQLSLKNLLLGGSEVPASEGEDRASLAVVRRELDTNVPNLNWADASEEIDSKIDSVLNQPIDGMLVSAWGKYKELQKYCNPEEYPPGKTVLASLAKHDVEAEFNPSVVIKVAGMDIASVELPIALSLQLEGVVLKIDGGRILAVQAGSLQAVGEIHFRLNMLRPKLPGRDLFRPIERTTEKFDFPAAIHFGDGYPIGPAQRDS